MASTNLSTKPQAIRKPQPNVYSEMESLPNFKPDFSIPSSANENANIRPHQRPTLAPPMTQNYGAPQVKQLSPRPQQQGIDELFGLPKTSPMPAPPPAKAQPAPPAKENDPFDFF